MRALRPKRPGGNTVKRKKYTTEQIIRKLCEVEQMRAAGTTAEVVCIV